MLPSMMMYSTFLIITCFVATVVSNFFIYTFEVHRKDGDSLYGWQFFNTPPSCLEVELAEITTTMVKVKGTPYDLQGIEWRNKMGHWISFRGVEVGRRHPSESRYMLTDPHGRLRGWCYSNTSNTWECDWGAGFGGGTSVVFCDSGLTANSVYG
ncbi:hypothetical protein GGS21DRAFT_113067 [Xylaria nigripes]|nr:hypothetical protein GGS21DRAFT_113067 [Xylaria nigripes]